MKSKEKKNQVALLYIGGIGLVVCFLLLEMLPLQILPIGAGMLLSLVLLIKGLCDFISSRITEIVGSEIESLQSGNDLEELTKINKATFMRVKKLNSDVEEVLDRSGMSKEEMERCNQILSDEIAKRQMCIANIQIKRNMENTDALLNSNDKILGQFSQISRMVQKNALETEISRKEPEQFIADEPEPVAVSEPVMAEEPEIAVEPEPEVPEEPVIIEEPEMVAESGPEEEPVTQEEIVPEDSIEIIDEDPNRQMTAEEIAALFNGL